MVLVAGNPSVLDGVPRSRASRRPTSRRRRSAAVLEAWLVDAGFATLAGGLLVATELERELAAGPRRAVTDSPWLTPWGARTRSSCGGEFVFVNQTAEQITPVQVESVRRRDGCDR
jgi:hypothetical protein